MNPAPTSGIQRLQSLVEVNGAGIAVTEIGTAAAEYLDYLAVERGAAANTLSSYRRDLARYLRFCQSRGIDAVSRVQSADVAAFVAYLRVGDVDRAGLTDSSINRVLSAVRGMHRYLLREGVVEVDPTAKVPRPRAPFRLPKALTVDEAIKLVTAVGGDDLVALRDRALLEFMYGTGARVSEVVSLDIDDLDLSAAAVLLRGKGGKQRIVPLGRASVEALDAYLVRVRPALAAKLRGAAGGDAAAVFLNQRGGRISRQGIWLLIQQAWTRSQITGAVSPHVLRHCFATHLLEGGADVRSVQELLGHASVTTTAVYTKVTIDQLREVYASTHPRAHR